MSKVRDCIRCARPYRPFGTTAIDYPGTLSIGAKGMCGYCYKADPGFTRPDPVERASLSAIEASLAAYLKWRAPFRAKAAKDMTCL